MLLRIDTQCSLSFPKKSQVLTPLLVQLTVISSANDCAFAPSCRSLWSRFNRLAGSSSGSAIERGTPHVTSGGRPQCSVDDRDWFVGPQRHQLESALS